MLLAACVVTWMVFWMRRQARTLGGHLRSPVSTALVAGGGFALASVAFVGVAASTGDARRRQGGQGRIVPADPRRRRRRSRPSSAAAGGDRPTQCERGDGLAPDHPEREPLDR